MSPVRELLVDLIREALSDCQINNGAEVAKSVVKKLFAQDETTRVLIGDCIGIGDASIYSYPLVIHFDSEEARQHVAEQFCQSGMAEAIPKRN